MKTLCSLLVTLLLLSGAAVFAQRLPESGGRTTELNTVGGVITLKVPQFETARQQLLVAVKNNGGTVVGSDTNVSGDGRKHGWLRFAVPAYRFSIVLDAVRHCGTLFAERVAAHDGTAEYEGLGHRATRLREHETRLDNLLQSNRRLRGSDILYVQERLFRAGVDESALEQQQTEMTRQARVATIQVALFEPISIRKSDQARLNLTAHFQAAQSNAQRQVSALMGRAMTVGAYMAVFAPVWVPCAVVLLLVLRWLWLRGRRWFLVGHRIVSQSIHWLSATFGSLLAQRLKPRPDIGTESTPSS
jgi:hypothetical protein